MCHVALIFFWNLENDHSCVVMQWLYLRCTNFLWRSETCSRMRHDTAWCTDAFWESGKCPQMRHAAVALLGVWKKFASASSFTHFLLVSAKSSLMWCAHWLWVPALRIWDLGFWGVQECATRQFSDGASGSEARMTLRRFQMGKLCSVNSRWTNLSWANFGWVNFRGKKKGSHVAF